MYRLIALVAALCCVVVTAQYNGVYHCRPGRDVVVHLFEWKWTDIERECAWLAQNNYCGVQVSPPQEHRVYESGPTPYPWWQRYQPVSYKVRSRSGTEQQFRSMVTTCNDLGVYIYVDAVINHMTQYDDTGYGSDGSYYDGGAQSYPGVPYSALDFNGPAECPTPDLNIWDYNDPIQVRNCRLGGLRDLKTGSSYVRDMVSNYLNKLISWGVAGFRIDAAKHMPKEDIKNILDSLTFLRTTWFPANTRPYVYQEVIDISGNEGVHYEEYVGIGRVTEFRHGMNLGNVIRKNDGQKLAYLRNYGEAWNQLNALNAFVFIDNHDNQRGHGAGGFGTILTFFEANMYKIANAFQLAWQYGHVRIMSSYNWPRNIVNGKDENDWMGPPSNSGGATKDVECFNGEWICEHRWRQIFNMVKFHNVALGQPVVNWWENGSDAIAFGRGDKGFIVINNENFGINQRLQTGLPAGNYCDVITCDNNRPDTQGDCGNLGGSCRPVITVDGSGMATFNVPNGEDPMIAIHV